MSRSPFAAILAAMAFLAAALTIVLSPRADALFDDDSIAYVEAARNFAAGRGMVTWPYGPEGFGEEYLPLQVFPPGFPLLIALVVRCGATAEQAATWIPRFLFALLPLVLYGVLRSVMDRAPALVATFVSCFLPTVLFEAMCAMSDVPFLFLVLVGFLCLFHGAREDDRRWLLAAGLLAGAASTVRNAGYAVPAAVTAAFLLCGRGRQLPLYLAGFATGYAPLVIRNVLVFGTPLPYDMPTSGMSVPSVLREALRGFDDMFVARLLVWPVLVPALAALGIGSAVWLWRSGTLRQLRSRERTDLLAGSVLLLYAAAGISMILLTRLRYDVDPVNSRFLMQYHWVLVAWCALVGARLLGRLPAAPPLRATAATAIAALLLLPQIPVGRRHLEYMTWSKRIAAEHAGLREVIRVLPPDVCIAAFHAPPLHLSYGRQVYQMPPAVSPRRASEFVGDRPLVVLVFPTDDEQYRDWDGVFRGELPDGYRELARCGQVVALERPGRP